VKKQVFMKKLSGHLTKMSKEERQDILSDFEEYFTYAAKDGEDEQAVCERLGDPKKIAREYYTQKVIEEANQTKSFKSMGRAVFASAGLSLVNFFYAICIVAVGYIVIASLYIAVVSIGLAGLAVIVASFIFMFAAGPQVVALGVIAGVGLAAFSVLAFIAVMQIAKLFRRGNMRFLNMTRRGKKGSRINE